ncbi:MAG TPA: hypothetical protein VJR89_40515 [Polyangiales bacterium]|nr:hypothetical protein [Polyangiales bacterium]
MFKHTDERGGVLVLGILLGVFSVAALAYLVDIGYASIWREGAQDAADAVAFESAVWEARGMNVLAAINIFIALTMAVLIAWRLALFALGLLTVASVVLCLFPATASLCATLAPRLGSATARMSARDPKVTRNVYKIIHVLHTGQRVVAGAMPILAAAQSSLSGTARPRVQVAAGFGTHLLPVRVLASLQSAAGGGGVGVTASALTGSPTKPAGPTKPSGPSTTKPGPAKPGQGEGCPVPGAKPRPPTKPDDKQPRKQRKLRASGELLGAVFSLPMERSEDLNVLCPRGTEMLSNGADLVVSTLLRELLGADVDGGAGAAGGAPNPGLIGQALRFVTDQLPQSGLCGDFAAMGDEFIEQQLDNACAEETQQQAKYDPLKKSGESWQDACRRLVKVDLESKQKSVADQQRANAKNRGASEPPAFAEIWGPLANGNLFAQSWSVANVEQDHSAIDRLVALAGAFGGVGGASGADTSGSALLLAQAEMFFDCEGDWDDSCYPNAAWTLNWRARLRRLHSPLDVAEAAAERAASRRFREILDAEPLRPLLAALPGGELAELFAPAAGGLLPESLRRDTEALRGQIAERGGRAARWVLEQGADRASFIH